MEAVGVVAICVVAVGAAAGILVGLRSLPDIRRYMKIRRM